MAPFGGSRARVYAARVRARVVLWGVALLAACSDVDSGTLDALPELVIEHPENAVEIVGLEQVLAVPRGPDDAQFAVIEGDVHFNLPPDFEAPTDVDGDGRYAFSLGSQPVTVVVVDVDEPPELVGASERSVPEGQRAVGSVQFEDPEGEQVILQLSTAGDGGVFELSSMGELSFLAEPDFEGPVDLDGDNLYRLRVEATDPAGFSASADLVVRVEDRPEPIEPRVEILFPQGELTVGESVAVLVEVTGLSARATVELRSGAGSEPLTRTTRARFRGRLRRGTSDAEIVARDFGRELRAPLASPFGTRPVRVPVAVEGVWALDVDGPRVLRLGEDRVLTEIQLPRMDARDIVPRPRGEGPLVLSDDALFVVEANGQVGRVAVAPLSGATGVTLLSDAEALVVEASTLRRVSWAPAASEVVSGRDRGQGPPLMGAVDVHAVGQQAFVQLGDGALIAVDLGSGDRRLVADVGLSRSAFGLAREGGTLFVLSEARLTRFDVDRGVVLDASEVRNELGGRLRSGRLGGGAGELVFARAVPALLGALEGSPPAAVGRFGRVGEGPALSPIEALDIAADRGWAVLGRDQLARIEEGQLQRSVQPLDLPAPSAFAHLSDGSALVADRDRDLLLRVRPGAAPEPLSDPAERLERGLEAPVAVGGTGPADAWVVDGAPPAIFRLDAMGWSLPFPDLSIGFPSAAAFDLDRGEVFLLDGARGRVLRVRPHVGGGVEARELGTFTSERARHGSLRRRALRSRPDGGGPARRPRHRRSNAGQRCRSKRDGDALFGATALTADGRGRLLVGRADGGVMLVEIESGDRTVVAR